MPISAFLVGGMPVVRLFIAPLHEIFLHAKLAIIFFCFDAGRQADDASAAHAAAESETPPPPYAPSRKPRLMFCQYRRGGHAYCPRLAAGHVAVAVDTDRRQAIRRMLIAGSNGPRTNRKEICLCCTDIFQSA